MAETSYDQTVQEFKTQIHKLCQQHLWPTMESDDSQEKFRMDHFHRLGELGLAGITTPEIFGGMGLDYPVLCSTLQEVARTSVSYAVTLSVTAMVQNIINHFGNEQQKKKYLPELASGQEIGAFALTEPGAGSDARNLQTIARKAPGGYILHGSKMFITSGSVAKTFIVMAQSIDDKQGQKQLSAYIVERGTPGFHVGKKEKKMGWKISPTCELSFDQCFIPESQLLQQEGIGFEVAKFGLAPGRITIGAIAVGLAQEAIDRAVVYAQQRKQFGQAIIDFQGIEFMLAEMATETHASHLMVQDAARFYQKHKNEYKRCGYYASMAKLKATDNAMKVTTDALQIFGGVGYTTEFPMERFMRDAKALQIVEGTNQIQKVVIARHLKQTVS